MSLEWDEEAQHYRINGVLPDEDVPNPQLSDEDYTEMGIFRPEEEEELNRSFEEGQQYKEEKAKNPLTKTDNIFGHVTKPKERDEESYEKLSVGDTLKDVGKSMFVEGAHFFQPKQNEWQYTPRTHAAERMMYVQRYVVPTILFAGVTALTGGLSVPAAGAVAGTAGAANVASKAGLLARIGQTLQPATRLVSGNIPKLAEAAKTSKAASYAKDVLDLLPFSVIQGAWATRPEEGEGLIGDMIPEDKKNAFFQFFSTNEADSGLEYRAKAALQDIMITPFATAGMKYLIAPTFKAAWKGVKATKDFLIKPTKETAEALDIAMAKQAKVNDGTEMIMSVREAIEEAQEQGVDDFEEFILNKDFVNAGNKGKIKEIYEALMREDEVIPLENGAFSINVTKWQDAAEVDVDDLAKQTIFHTEETVDEQGNNIFKTVNGYGDEVDPKTAKDSIQLMDEAVEAKFRKEGLLAEKEKLITKTQQANHKTKITVNTKAVNRIRDYYKDKFKIDNKIDIEFVDGKIDGAEGQTTLTQYQGKAIKQEKATVEKQKLTIEKIEDKLRQLEGEESELDQKEILERELKIAQTKLRELLIAAANRNRMGNISIRIDKNSPNPYAVLRSELEHARDYAKGTTPKKANVKGSGEHFSRYEGDNESEMAVQYVKRKADNLKAKQNGGETVDIQSTNINTETDYHRTPTIANLENRYKSTPLEKAENNVPKDLQAKITSEKKETLKQAASLLSKAVDLNPNYLIQLIRKGGNRNLEERLIKAFSKDSLTSSGVSEEGGKLRPLLKDKDEETIINKLMDILQKGGISETSDNMKVMVNAAQEAINAENSVKEILNRTLKSGDFDRAWEEFSQLSDDVQQGFIDYFSKELNDIDNVLAKNPIKSPITQLDDYVFEEVNSGQTSNQFYGHDTLVMKNKAGEELAYVRYKERGGHSGHPNIRIDWMENKGIQKGVARKALAKLMNKLHPDVKVYWEAINEESTKSYQHFVEEYPELAKRVDFFDNSDITKDLDYKAHKLYNSEKGVIDETTANISQNNRRTGTEISGVDNSTEAGTIQENQIRNDDFRGISKNGRGGNLDESVYPNVRGREAANNYDGNINPTEAVIKADGDLNVVENAIQKQISEAPTMKDYTFKSFGEHAEEVYQKMNDMGVDTTSLKEAFAKGDINFVNHTVAKQLAAVNIMRDLRVQLLEIADNPEKVLEQRELIEGLHILSLYTNEIASSMGAGLGTQRFTKKVRKFFDVSDRLQAGISSIADIVEVELKSSNFTRAEMNNVKQKLWNSIKETNPENFNMIVNDTELFEVFDSAFNKLINDKITDRKAIESVLTDIAQRSEREEIIKALKSCTADEVIPKTVKSFGQKVGEFTVHTNLTNPKTAFRNLISGVQNSIYFPMKKWLKGKLLEDVFRGAERGQELQKEALNTYVGWSKAYQDAWKLAKQAFMTGDGQIINFGKRVNKINNVDVPENGVFGLNATEIEGTLGSLADWDKKSFSEKSAMVISMFTRFLGASDEFLAQLNYRGIAYAKSLEHAEQIAKLTGHEGDVKFLNEETARAFTNKFTKEGKITDMAAFAEARDMTYQTPLSGKYWDENAGEYYQVKDQTATMAAGQFLQDFVSKFPQLKVFSLFQYIRTPMNIFQQNLEHNPIYLALSPAQQKIWQSGAEGKADVLARGVFGLMSMGLTGSLAAAGFLTGAPPADSKTRQALYRTGWRPYSFVTKEGQYVSYQGIEPFNSYAAVGATAWEAFNSYQLDKDSQFSERLGKALSRGVSAISNSTIEKSSFRNGINQISLIMDICDGNDGDGRKYDELIRSANEFRPFNGLVSNLSTLGETEARSAKGLEILDDKYFNQGRGEFKRNVFGERTDVYNLLIMSAEGDKGEHPEDVELMRMASIGYAPSPITKFENDSTINFTQFKNKNENGESLYSLLNDTMSTIEVDGQTLREAVRELVQSEEYIEAVDGLAKVDDTKHDTKKNMLNTIFKRYKDAAKNEVIDEYGENYVNSRGETIFDVREQEILLREREETDRTIDDIWDDIRSFE